LSYMTRHRFGLWNKGRLAIALALVLLLLFPGCARVTDGAAIVTRVIDGDTIEIEGGYRVRYIGIDTPERDESYYWEALQANRDLVEGKKVWLEKDVEDRDRYDRLLRYVWVDNTMVNAELVRLGYAYSYAYPPNLKYQTYLLQMEKEAREHKRGLWSGD
jgi:micrococcal nuclease